MKLTPEGRVKGAGLRAGQGLRDRAPGCAQPTPSGERAASRRDSILRIVLFGSLARGIPTPGSDADLLIVVGESPFARSRDRIPDMLDAIYPLPCPLDLFVVTQQEINRAEREGSLFLRRILETGLELWPGSGPER